MKKMGFEVAFNLKIAIDREKALCILVICSTSQGFFNFFKVPQEGFFVRNEKNSEFWGV